MLRKNNTTLNNNKKNSVVIEQRFEDTRENYLRDLDKLRRRYAKKFVSISKEYGSTCLTAN